MRARRRKPVRRRGQDRERHRRQAVEFKFVVSQGRGSRLVVFKFSNSATASLPHDFKICSSPKGSLAKNVCVGKTSKTISPGAKTTLTFTFKTKGTYEYLCTIPGHAAAGMKGLLKVT